ncbi:hypothetical protein HPP92_005573 [Vanilla planifolia]|uniref:Uncharacterized protein n=1 Tax=Vanilla planifolia TaxID=51239 RepID=A0A835RSD9_VANPL|nr:hypothetical protein HPP92_005573 [Vanilla planifolia]
MASARRFVVLFLLVLSIVQLLMAANAARVLKEEYQVITTRAGFVFESKPKGFGPSSDPSGCHHGPGGDGGDCPMN